MTEPGRTVACWSVVAELRGCRAPACAAPARPRGRPSSAYLGAARPTVTAARQGILGREVRELIPPRHGPRGAVCQPRDFAWWRTNARVRSRRSRFDDDPGMPDALEAAAPLDRRFVRPRRLAGAALRRVRDQGPERHVRHAHDVGRWRVRANDRPPADADARDEAPRRGRDHPRQGEHGRVRPAVYSTRSSYGGTMLQRVRPDRDAGASSRLGRRRPNLVSCALDEEPGKTVCEPVQEQVRRRRGATRVLVSGGGMASTCIATRFGPECRTVEDRAPLEAFAGSRTAEPSRAAPASLRGIPISALTGLGGGVAADVDRGPRTPPARSHRRRLAAGDRGHREGRLGRRSTLGRGRRGSRSCGRRT